MRIDYIGPLLRRWDGRGRGLLKLSKYGGSQLEPGTVGRVLGGHHEGLGPRTGDQVCQRNSRVAVVQSIPGLATLMGVSATCRGDPGAGCGGAEWRPRKKNGGRFLCRMFDLRNFARVGASSVVRCYCTRFFSIQTNTGSKIESNAGRKPLARALPYSFQIRGIQSSPQDSAWVEQFKKATVDLASMDIHGITYEKSAERMRTLLKTGLLKHADLHDNPERFFLAHRLLAHHAPKLGPGFWIRFTVHYNLCVGTVLALGNPQQVEDLKGRPLPR